MKVAIGPGWWTRPYQMEQATQVLQGVPKEKALPPRLSKLGPADHDHFTEQAILALRDAEHWIKRFYGSELMGVYLTRKEDGWLGTVKAAHKGADLVAFVTGESASQTLVNLAYALGHKKLQWKPSRY